MISSVFSFIIAEKEKPFLFFHDKKMLSFDK